MILYPNAKINIGLKILNKRDDGFHNIETLFYPIELADILEIVESETVSMKEYGIDIPGRSEENICIKAYNLLRQDFDIPPVEINLYKKIPVGAGLGGGSSDGAHTILLLDTLFNLNLTHNQKVRYASRLGSDCPFFIENRPMLGYGKGEKLEPFDPALGRQAGQHKRRSIVRTSAKACGTMEKPCSKRFRRERFQKVSPTCRI